MQNLPTLLVAVGVVSFAVLFGCSKDGDHRYEGDHDHVEGAHAADKGPAATDSKKQSALPTTPKKATDEPPEPDLLALELKAHEAAKTVLEDACASCHTTALAKSKKAKVALKHFVMDSYPYGGHHKDELGASIRKVLGVDGAKATMPKDDPGSIQASRSSGLCSGRKLGTPLRRRALVTTLEKRIRFTATATTNTRCLARR